MLAELRGKGGCVCQPARRGELKCPLIVRPTSEDVITAAIFQVFGTLNPRWWLADLLNEALGVPRFRRQFHRGLTIDLWANRPRYPRELLPWAEGSTQVNACVRWANPATTVYFEAKFRSDLSSQTSNGGGQAYPSDQLVRNARVGLLETGWFGESRLLPTIPGDFVLILISPLKGHPLVDHYRDPANLLRAIPHSDRLLGLPSQPFIGSLGFREIIGVLERNRRWWSRPERRLVSDLVEYLEFKLTASRGSRYEHPKVSEYVEIQVPDSETHVPIT